MADLSTLRPEDTYGGLLQAPGGVGASPVAVQSGAGVSLPLTVSTTAVAFTAAVDLSAAFIPSVLTVRPPGGTPGVDQLEVSHTGSLALVRSQDGPVEVRNRTAGGHGDVVFRVTRVDGAAGDADCCYFYQTGSQIYLSVPAIMVRQTYDSDVRIRLGVGAGVSFGNATVSAGTRSGLRDGGATGVVDLFAGTDGARANQSGAALRSVPLTPAQLTADQNDYAPSASPYRYYRLSADAPRAVTGLSVGQVDGLECEIWNVGSHAVTLAHQSASSAAANRFLCPGAANVALAADEVALLRYDAATSRWRVRKV